MTGIGGRLGLSAALLATLSVVPAGPAPVLVAAVGVGILAWGWATRRADRVTVGGLGVLAGVLYGALVGQADALVVLGTLASVVAWDATEQAVTLHHQLGAAAATMRAELAHIGATVAAGAAVGGLALLTVTLGRGRLPALAGILLVAGAIALVFGLLPVGRASAD